VSAALLGLLLGACHPLAAGSAPAPALPDAGPSAVLAPVEPSDLVYFVLVDRFANGDPGNDRASPGPAPDPADPQGWHGGDLRGVLEHLDELQALGATTLWLSPVFRTRTEPMGGWGAYHGYWLWDPDTVEPRFGTTAELQALAQALRDRGMGLVLDMVYNHLGYDAPLLQSHPEYFHHVGTIEDWNDREQLETREVHGLPDLDQDLLAVAQWLTRASLGWRDRLQPRGFRVDAVRHMPNAFLRTLGEVLRQGEPGLWWLGEDFTGDPVALADSQRTGGFSHVFDFPLYYAMTDVFCDDAAPSRLASVLWEDRLYPRPEGLVTFLDNHDLPRLQSRCHGEPERVEQALTFLFATRGVPSLSYGTESALQGEQEPANRGDMDYAHRPLAPLITRLAGQRAEHPAMRGGVQRVISLGPQHMAVARVQGADLVVVGLNQGDRPVPLVLPPELAPTGPALSLPPHQLVVWPMRRLPQDGAARTWAAQGPLRRVPVEVQGAPSGGRLVLVGGDPLLGGWDPAHGLALAEQDGAWRGEVQAPEGAVLEGKPVWLGDDGSATWAPGDNRALLVGPHSDGGSGWVMAW